MATLGMGEKYYIFTSDVINKVIGKKSPGNYALGYINEKNGKFVVRYVGRSDNDLNDRIKDHLGENDAYECFKFCYKDSPKAAFEKECENWHDFGGPYGRIDNDIHPDKPNNCNWKCPICGK